VCLNKSQISNSRISAESIIDNNNCLNKSDLNDSNISNPYSKINNKQGMSYVSSNANAK